MTLPADEIARLEEAVASGSYRSRDEIILEALRLWGPYVEDAEIDDADLKEADQSGVASGDPVRVSIPDLIVSFKTRKNG